MERPTVLTHEEVLTPEHAEAFASLIDVPVPDLAADGLPLLWHWLYLSVWPAQRDIGADGHPTRGSLPVPPAPGQRRMWAGGRVRTQHPLVTGRTAVRRSEVVSTTTKQGRSGPLTFVVVEHRITQDGVTCVVEEQDIVYREAVAPDGPGPVPTPDGPAATPAPVAVPPAAGERRVALDPPHLFRFSALTRNAHRIHYDREYARSVEGYPALVVHGPLQALLMAESARAAGAVGRLTMNYRLVSPLLEHQGLVTGSEPSPHGWNVHVRDDSGRVTATGTVSNEE
ncbi:MaoC family dehydratase N-terminal domain-containing protein [Micromonospora sp. NPDC049051]|uniref:FAS1-like dehydratase domain-containing protein n=1 Tax=Micromonospora sp. NPDC049051 TaxID=3364264 RepID=UPI00371501AF